MRRFNGVRIPLFPPKSRKCPVQEKAHEYAENAMFMGFFRYICGLFVFHKVSQSFIKFQSTGRRKYAVKMGQCLDYLESRKARKISCEICRCSSRR